MEFSTQHDQIQYDSSLEFIKLIPNSINRIADIGSGPGYQAQALVEKGHDVVCVDYVRPEIPDFAVEWQHPDQCNLSDLDAVWSHHALEHIRDPIGALIKWRSYLKPGGHLFLTVPEIGTTMSSGHINIFNLPMLMYTLAVSGYTTKGRKFVKSRSHLRAWVTKANNYNPEKEVLYGLEALADLDLFPESVSKTIKKTGRFDNQCMHLEWNNSSYNPTIGSIAAIDFINDNMWRKQ